MKDKKSSKTNESREHRIYADILVDTYTEEEQISGWWHHLAETLKFPFHAKCIKRQSISPLKLNEIVEVVEIAAFEDCQRDMFVIIQWCGRQLGVPLNQLELAKPSKKKKIKQAIEDWRYWSKY